MKNLVERLLVFFIGLPLLLSMVLVFSQNNHMFFNLTIFVFSVLGALELRNILGQKSIIISSPEAAILGGITPLIWTLVVSFGFSCFLLPAAFIMGATWLLVSGIFITQEKLVNFINRIAAGFVLMIYPGLFMTWVIQMAVFPQAGMVILIFLLVVFLNDAAAWVFGMLFGKNNRGYIAASPGKSIVGFIGGMIISVLTGIIATLLIPGAFASTVMPSAPAGAILGLAAGIAATLGDLCESAMKRSAGVKDSGTLILGRGGALDSIDSLALAAPVYYLIYQVLFQ